MTPAAPRVLIGVDPGRSKCGVAVCAPGVVHARSIVTPDALPGLIRQWADRFSATEVVVGDRTGSDAVVASLGAIGIPVRRIDEAGTTLRARARYFADHPPRGWRRLVPQSLQTPPEPYDDYVAVLLAEAVLAEGY